MEEKEGTARGSSKKETLTEGLNRLASRKLISCLTDKVIYVRWIPKEGGIITDPKHVLAGGMAPTAKRTYTVPMLKSGTYANPLTNEEKAFLEAYMGLEPNALSVYKKDDNYWDNRQVELGKGTTTLHLSDPNDYIRYKILLMNKDFIAPDEITLKNARKATYQYVITGNNEDDVTESLDKKSRAYKKYADLKNEIEKLALIVEETTGRSVAKLKKETIYREVEKAIDNHLDAFLKYAEDLYLDTKLLLYRSLDIGTVRRKGTYFYLTDGMRPLCTGNQEPTLQSACEMLNNPRYQEIKFTLEAKLNNTNQ
ncbi:MAG: hypothetical protein LBE56_12570 [Tannerella sp.]|jgi:hypothetical protein|nr:hypothetical protein [Tannerella sp.]